MNLAQKLNFFVMTQLANPKNVFAKYWQRPGNNNLMSVNQVRVSGTSRIFVENRTFPKQLILNSVITQLVIFYQNLNICKQ